VTHVRKRENIWFAAVSHKKIGVDFKKRGGDRSK
jgi:hypothetical protein